MPCVWPPYRTCRNTLRATGTGLCVFDLRHVPLPECGYRAGRPAGAVLFRAVAPFDEESALTPQTFRTHGPGRLTRTLDITREQHNHVDMTDAHSPLSLWQTPQPVPDEAIMSTTRIGITKATEYPWRFYLRGNPWVSVQQTGD